MGHTFTRLDREKILVEKPEPKRETIAKLDYFAWTDIYVAVIIQGTSLHGNSNLAFRLEGVFDVRLRPFPLDIKLYCPRERERESKPVARCKPSNV